VQVDREQQRKVEAAGRAERGVRERITIPGQVLQQGRSRRGVHSSPQNVTKRPKEQPAAGYVPQVPEVAYGFLDFYKGATLQKDLWRIYSGDGTNYKDIDRPAFSQVYDPEPSYINTTGVVIEVATFVDFRVLPVNKETLLFLFQKLEITTVTDYVYIPFYPNPGGILEYGASTRTAGPASSEFCIVSKTGIRQVSGVPSVASDWMQQFIKNNVINYEQQYPYDNDPFFSQGISVGLESVNGVVTAPYQGGRNSSHVGSLGAIRAISGLPETWSPTWINFTSDKLQPNGPYYDFTPDPQRFWQGHIIRSLDSTNHYPISSRKGTIVRSLKIPVKAPGIDVIDNGPGSVYNRQASSLLVSWDWGKPALCRQLLLQLGFSPSDLSP